MKIATIVTSVLLVIALIFGVTMSAQLSNTKSQLATTTTQLTTTQQELATTQSDLTSAKSQLSASEAKLTDSETKLKTANDQLTAANNQLTTTKSQLATAQSQLTSTQSQLTAAQNTNTEMVKQYAGLKGQVDLRFGFGTDGEKFVTPDDTQVAARARAIAGSYASDPNELWNDYQRMYNWVVDNIQYAYDSYVPLLPEALGGTLTWRTDCWRTPEETLTDEHGDCEDMATLLASLMRSYNQKDLRVWVITIQSDSGGHAAVALPVIGDKMVIYDPAGNYYSGYLDGYVQSDSTSQALYDWLNYWESDLPGAYVATVFADDYYRAFDGTQAFITWCNGLPDSGTYN